MTFDRETRVTAAPAAAAAAASSTRTACRSCRRPFHHHHPRPLYLSISLSVCSFPLRSSFPSCPAADLHPTERQSEAVDQNLLFCCCSVAACMPAASVVAWRDASSRVCTQVTGKARESWLRESQRELRASRSAIYRSRNHYSSYDRTRDKRDCMLLALQTRFPLDARVPRRFHADSRLLPFLSLSLDMT